MEEIAQVYSRSLFEVAKEHGVLDEVHEQLNQFADALGDERQLQVFFFSPYFSADEKKAGVGKVVEGANEHFQRFLELLAERHRLPVTFRIRDAFNALWAKENKLLAVSVTSAVPLDEETVASIGRAVEEQTDRRVELEAHVDDDVLGGLVLQVGNTVLDASVRNRLEQLRKQVTRAA